jgi:hypothetical protein
MTRSIFFASMAAFTLLTAVVYGGNQNGANQTSISNQPAPEGTLGKYVGKDGAITLPEDYRLKWIHLGSWYIEDKKGGPGEVHDVYAEPETVAAFRNTGKWPQGATLVKEIRAGQKGEMTTGNVHWDGQIKQWFVMVKDTEKKSGGGRSTASTIQRRIFLPTSKSTVLVAMFRQKKQIGSTHRVTRFSARRKGRSKSIQRKSMAESDLPLGNDISMS